MSYSKKQITLKKKKKMKGKKSLNYYRYTYSKKIKNTLVLKDKLVLNNGKLATNKNLINKQLHGVMMNS
jgi:uncharacterized protein YaiL (DUF2058 family)